MKTSPSHIGWIALATLALALASACGGAVQVQSLQLSNLPGAAVAGGVQTVYVTALDANGNTVQSYQGTVHFTSSSAALQVPADYTFVPADLGTHPFSITFDALGAVTLTATDTSSAALRVTQGTSAVAPALTSLTVDIPSGAASGQPFDLTVTVIDSWGGPATLYTGTVHFTSTDSQATLPADYTFTADDQGVHTFAGGATLVSGGLQSITATDAADSLAGHSTSATVQ